MSYVILENSGDGNWPVAIRDTWEAAMDHCVALAEKCKGDSGVVQRTDDGAMFTAHNIRFIVVKVPVLWE